MILKLNLYQNLIIAVLIRFYGCTPVPDKSVNSSRPNIIFIMSDDVWELYDLKNDPHEVNNIYEKPQNSELIVELKDELTRLRNQYKVPTDHFQVPYVKAGNDQKL